MKLTGSDKSLLETSLRIAAEQFDRDAFDARNLPNERLQKQFEGQAQRAREMMAALEEAEALEVQL